MIKSTATTTSNLVKELELIRQQDRQETDLREEERRAALAALVVMPPPREQEHPEHGGLALLQQMLREGAEAPRRAPAWATPTLAGDLRVALLVSAVAFTITTSPILLWALEMGGYI